MRIVESQMIKRRSSIGIVVMVFLLAFTSCDGFTEVEGRVFDKEDNAIEGAHIVLRNGSRIYNECKSRADGTFSLLTSNAPWQLKMTLVVSKEGFKTMEKQLSANERYRNEKIVLETVP